MTGRQRSPVRVVHLDPDGFGDVSIERAAFEAALDDVTFDVLADAGDDLAGTVGRADVLLTHYTEIDAQAMEAIRPEVIVRYATGFDGIDMEAANRLGVRITRVPEYCDEEVADHVIALALALWRRLPQYGAHVARGGWEWRHAAPGRRFAEATFGFLGFGRKARASAARARALGCTLVAYDPHLGDDGITDHGAEPVGLDELLRRAHVLSIHAPLTPETEGLVDARALGLMPAGAIVVNTARGRIIDEAALVAALDAGRLAGAGLDVLCEEPPPSGHPLLGRDDVIVTPHAAWYSEQAERDCRELGTRFAIEALRGETCDGLVNPEALAGADGAR
ncbi:MAG: C-terminal binding protein [Halofilum sp. (in: g-proteobacteria)]|nr:C-terminal binding protein [Halofilum sp. (in: g-proteobacteria)]